MNRILTVIGARPQFIKASVVSKAIAEHANLREIILHTGQHFDANMSDVFDQLKFLVRTISFLFMGALTER